MTKDELTCLLSLNALLPIEYRLDVIDKSEIEIKKELEFRVKCFLNDTLNLKQQYKPGVENE